MQKGTRIVPRRTAGIIFPDAPFWRGERIDHLLAARQLHRNELAEQKRLARSRKRSSSGVGSAPGTRKPRSQSSTLRRLERALARRKTLEARQRIQQQIDMLKAELGA